MIFYMGKRANNLRWLFANNQLKDINQINSIGDDGVDTLATAYSIENIEIIWRLKCIAQILNKPKLTLNDKDELENLFYRLNSLVIVARNEYMAEQELRNGE